MYEQRSIDQWRKFVGMCRCLIKENVAEVQKKRRYNDSWKFTSFEPYPKHSVHFTLGYQKNNVPKYLYDTSYSLKRNPYKIYSVCPPSTRKICYVFEPFFYISTKHKIKTYIKLMSRECNRPLYHTTLPILKLDLKYALRKMSRRNKTYTTLNRYRKMKNITKLGNLIKSYDQGVLHSELQSKQRREELKGCMRIMFLYQVEEEIKKLYTMKRILVDNPRLSYNTFLNYSAMGYVMYDAQLLEEMLSLQFKNVPDAFGRVYEASFISLTVKYKYGIRRIITRIYMNELYCCDLKMRSGMDSNIPKFEVVIGKAGQCSLEDAVVFYHLPQVWRTLAITVEDFFHLKRWYKLFNILHNIYNR